MRLKDKVALVTGGGSGFGAGIAQRFAAEGAAVLVNDVNDDNGEGVVKSLREAGGKAAYVHADVSKDADTRSMLDAALKEFGRIDIVVNNAGVSHRNQPVLDVSEAEFDRVFDINVKAMFWSTRHFVPQFRKQGGGSFVNIASTAGVRPRPGLVWYNGSKGALIVISKTLAVELAPDRIRVNCINPVAGETPLLATFMGQDTPEMRQKFISTIPLGRFSQPLDIANAALFLASDDAGFITGVCLEVDGGRCV